jgi:hypothetical protein
MNCILTITQWKAPQRYRHQQRHFYGTLRSETGEVLQEILQCATRQRVIEVAKEWADRVSSQIYYQHKIKLDITINVKEGVEKF